MEAAEHHKRGRWDTGAVVVVVVVEGFRTKDSQETEAKKAVGGGTGIGILWFQ